MSTCSTNSGLEEGYGSQVICNNCIGDEVDEPPVKKTTNWCIRYPPVNTEPKRKIPKKRESKLTPRETRCICITCFKNEVEPSVYVMSRRDNHTKERHLRRRHPGLTIGEIEVFNFECFGKDIGDAKESTWKHKKVKVKQSPFSRLLRKDSLLMLIHKQKTSEINFQIV